MAVPSLKLNDGHQIPQVGLGTWKSTDSAQFIEAFNVAIAAGYRHIDTAQAYGNEQFLGEAWRQSGLKREELFITTKIAVQHFGYHNAKRTFAESLKKLQTDYVDLLLLHFPITLLRKKSWQALEEIQAAGQTKSIGVSNYTIRHLEDMHNYAKVKPAVNQVELHVFLQQPELVKYCQDNNIVVEAYSPIARTHIMDNPTILKIAKKYNKTYVQVMLRFLIERGLVVIPKSVNPDRIKENIDLFDFKLNAEEMVELAKENRDLRVCWNPTHIP